MIIYFIYAFSPIAKQPGRVEAVPQPILKKQAYEKALWNSTPAATN